MALSAARAARVRDYFLNEGRISADRLFLTQGAAKDAGARTPSIDAIRRAQAGDRAALEAVLASARPRVVALALRMVRDADEAEDVVQDA